MKAKVWVDGKKDEAITISLISDAETGKSRVAYSGSNPDLKEFFVWTAENDHDGDAVIHGLEIVPLLPVRPSTFPAFIHRGMTYATIGLGAKVRFTVEDLPTAPGNRNMEGKQSRYL